jgi:hypothetical protein
VAELTILGLNRKLVHDRLILGKHAKQCFKTSKQATELILDLLTYYLNLTATTLGRVYTSRKDRYTLGEIYTPTILLLLLLQALYDVWLSGD